MVKIKKKIVLDIPKVKKIDTETFLYEVEEKCIEIFDDHNLELNRYSENILSYSQSLATPIQVNTTSSNTRHLYFQKNLNSNLQKNNSPHLKLRGELRIDSLHTPNTLINYDLTPETTEIVNEKNVNHNNIETSLFNQINISSTKNDIETNTPNKETQSIDTIQFYKSKHKESYETQINLLSNQKNVIAITNNAITNTEKGFEKHTEIRQEDMKKTYTKIDGYLDKN